MADEQHRWLDGDAAEQMLRGEPLDFVDDGTRARAARLAETLAALAAEPPRAGAELPGEAAALAAFRAARDARAVRAVRTGESLAGAASVRTGAHAVGAAHAARGTRTVDTVAVIGPDAPGGAAGPTADAGLVRLGRPAPGRRGSRLGRPLRLGLAAALAAGMISGVAVAAGSGVLPAPFSDDPEPAASVSADETARQPVNSPPPGTADADEPPTTPRAPDGTSGAPTREDSSHDEASGGSTAPDRPGADSTPDPTAGTQEWWTAVRSACRDMAGGKDMGSRRMRGLEDAAGGSGRVKTFCKFALGDHRGGGSGPGRGQGGDGSGGDHHGGGTSDPGGGGGGDDDGHIWPGSKGVGLMPSTSHSLGPASSVLPLSPGGTKTPVLSFGSPAPSVAGL
ncbi:hypothetical protein AB0C59_00215 [Streptomyces sp. NPDC048664]|uniref:hypothetical protein n=1 Tax=Streptomyces sp. NPDC048664 TaxID=3154505 RepID=UPI0034347F15